MKEDVGKNKFDETWNSTGFFKQYFNEFKVRVSAEQLDSFSSLKTDEERVIFASKILPDCDEMRKEGNNGKDGNEAAKLKEKGNAEFVRGDTSRALASYTNAILKTPFNSESNTEIAIMLANRSAALYHLEQFEDAIQDIEMALQFSYPKEMRYKILDRKARCLLALKRHNEAIDAFRQTLHGLDDSKLATEKKLKMQNDIQIMLNLMNKQKTQQGHVNALVEGKKPAKRELLIPPVIGKKNQMYPSLSDSVTVKEEPGMGRFAAASAAIEPGGTVVVEKPFCAVLLAEQATTHCAHCFKRTTSAYPCSGCSAVVFCGPTCQEAANASYHKYECEIAEQLYRSGASVMVQMALRIVSQKNLAYFLDYRKQLEEPRSNSRKHKCEDYLSIYHLVRHEDQRGVEDFFERAVMAVFLLRALQRVGYFGAKNPNPSGQSLSSEESFIDSLILRHLQLLQFNAHEIAELETECTESAVESSTSIFLGGGIFPTLSLFNHSCDPAIVRYFIGTTVVARTIRPLVPGDILAENYGPIFTVKPRTERRKVLRAHYWFDCACQSCEEDWPLLKSMDRKIIRFRCEGSDEVACNGIIEVPHNTDNFMPKCGRCNQHTNLLKGLKILQDTDAMFRQASLDMDRGKLQSALDTYLKILSLLYKHLAPPFYDYHLCQQAIRKCMLSLGNRYSKEI